MDFKLKAIENCREVEMGVTLVSIISPDINLHQIGDLIKFAKKNVPTVKGTLPTSQLLRAVPHRPQDVNRTVLPDLLVEIEKQTNGS